MVGAASQITTILKDLNCPKHDHSLIYIEADLSNIYIINLVFPSSHAPKAINILYTLELYFSKTCSIKNSLLTINHLVYALINKSFSTTSHWILWRSIIKIALLVCIIILTCVYDLIEMYLFNSELLKMTHSLTY